MGKLIRLILCGVLAILTFESKAQSMLSESVLIFSTDKGIIPEDSSALFTIKDILINGNERTRNSVILRELPFSNGASYQLNKIVAGFYDVKKRLMNTGLFRSVIVSLRSIENRDVYVQIDVEEKWYLYPLPFIRVADDNFGNWWSEKGRKLDQLNYGIRITQENATGRNDKIQLYVMNGYTKQLMLQYKGLYLDHDLKWYTNLSLSHGKNREINYITQNNRPLALKNPAGFIRTFSNASVDVVYRPAIKTRHTLTLGYYSESFADTVHKLNSNFSNSLSVHVPTIGYNVSYVDVDFVHYPTKGFVGEFGLSKVGLSGAVNMWQMSAMGNYSWPAFKKSIMNLRMVGMVKLPFRQPYTQQDFIGHNDMFLQGYENYVVDGVAGGYTKLAFIHPIVNASIKPPKTAITKKFRLFNPIPIKVYAKVFSNVGYVHNPNATPANELNNKMLYSGGIGLDVVAFADMIFKIEWSFNQLGQNGLYLHQRERY